MLLEGVDNIVDRRAGLVVAVAGEPLHDIEFASGVERIGRNGVAVQVVEGDGLVSFSVNKRYFLKD